MQNAKPTGVLCGVDGSTGSEAALLWAAGEAVLAAEPLVLLHATGPGEGNGGRAILERARRRVRRDFPILPVTTTLSDQRPGEALAVREATMVVVGRRGAGGFGRLQLGSTAVAVATGSSAPVVVVPTGAHPIESASSEVGAGPLLAVDVADPAPQAARFAFDVARSWSRTLRAVAVWTEPGDGVEGSAGIRTLWQQHDDRTALALRQLLHRWSLRYPEVDVEPVVAHGHPAGAVLEQERSAGLLVLGRGSRPGSLGANARVLLQLASVPVAVVP